MGLVSMYLCNNIQRSRGGPGKTQKCQWLSSPGKYHRMRSGEKADGLQASLGTYHEGRRERSQGCVGLALRYSTGEKRGEVSVTFSSAVLVKADCGI